MFLQIGQHNHHIRLAGDRKAPALVLLHSLGTSHALWQSQIEALSATHFTIAPDFRGHGLSDETQDPLSCEGLADDVEAVLAALNVTRCHVAGISLGGVIAQILAARLGEACAGLALFDTYIKAADPQMWRDRADKVRVDGLESIAAGVRKVWMTDEEAATPEGRGMARMLEICTDHAYAAACDALAGADCSATTPSLPCKTVVAYGSEDHAAPQAAAEELAGAIKGAGLVRIEGAGHLPLLTQAEPCTDIIRSIL
ncbi:alpha/beta fold hydrolase [Pseudooceanicola nitratireducens]|uniref:alpha/beta fold hydrolase n=1 Tax=Pseudooceanicola nitratireducens TaxID=517719 RepID=UPI0023F0C788|nr:alpha/beta fold hydrolase [Pseudooceanicola nitratireducens]